MSASPPRLHSTFPLTPADLAEEYADSICHITTRRGVQLLFVHIEDKGGGEQRGFEVYVGGGLGAVPQPAKLFDEFVPEEETRAIAQAIARVFAN